jgi:hypothetical protein
MYYLVDPYATLKLSLHCYSKLVILTVLTTVAFVSIIAMVVMWRW